MMIVMIRSTGDALEAVAAKQNKKGGAFVSPWQTE